MVPIFHLQFSKTYYDHNIKRKSETQRNLVDGLGLADVATVYTNRNGCCRCSDCVYK
jgi:hypothetical protein